MFDASYITVTAAVRWTRSSRRVQHLGDCTNPVVFSTKAARNTRLGTRITLPVWSVERMRSGLKESHWHLSHACGLDGPK